jgi:uncharacterized membrane protein
MSTSSDRQKAVLLYAVAGLGVIIRILRLLDGRSLWLDETMLADNFMKYSYRALIGPLDSLQSAPLLYLWIERALTEAFGFSEQLVRLPACIASICCLPLLYGLLRRWLSYWPVLFGMALFAVLPSAVYYSAEVKQYAFDLFFALLLITQACGILEHPRRLRLAAFCGTGALAIWASTTAVFVEAGVGSVLICRAIFDRRRKDALLLTGVCAIWLACFAVDYELILSRQIADGGFQRVWAKAFLPLLPRSMEDVGILAYHFFHFFSSPFFTWHEVPHRLILPSSSALVCFGFCVGCCRLYRRNTAAVYLLLMPVAVAVVVSALRLYPFRERFLLFLVPSILVLLCAGIEQVAESFGPQLRKAAVVMPVLLLVLAALGTAMVFARPNKYEDVRPAFAYVARRMQPGDAVYIHNRIMPQYLFYSKYVPACRLKSPKLIAGATDADGLKGLHKDFEALKNYDRIWYLYGPPWDLKDTEGGFIGAGLSRILELRDKQQWERTEAHLYTRKKE